MFDHDDPPAGLKHAATWRLVADILRRHCPNKDLRVYELHPAGGMGDTVSLREMHADQRMGQQLNDFRGWRRMGIPGTGRHPYALGPDGYYVEGRSMNSVTRARYQECCMR